MAMMKSVVFLPQIVLDEYAAMSKMSRALTLRSYACGARRRD